jgi:hypothetical protein
MASQRERQSGQPSSQRRPQLRSPGVAAIQRHTHYARIARPERAATRTPANSQSMASGDLTITLSRVGSLRAGRRGDHYVQTSHVLNRHPARAFGYRECVRRWQWHG